MWGVPLFPEQASTVAPRVDAVYFYLLAVCGSLSLAIAVLVVFFALRYRRSREAHRAPLSPRAVLALEIAWISVPLVLVSSMFAWGAVEFYRLQFVPADALDVYVVGRQWMWKLQHPSGRREINELHVPRGRPVRLVMTSQDVIHSFFVPAFRIKQDVLPGRYTTAWFEATRTGTYHLFCAEYCGTDHSGMVGRVVVMDPSAYQAWLQGAEGGTVDVVTAGRAVFERLGCGACHRSGGLGPDLAKAPKDDNRLRRSILEPRAELVPGFEAVMPSYQGRATEEELLQLIAYVKSL